MSHYLAHATPMNISCILVIAVALYLLYKISTHRSTPKKHDGLTLTGSIDLGDHPAPRYPVNEQKNLADILMTMESLRTPLKNHRNPTHPGSML